MRSSNNITRRALALGTIAAMLWIASPALAAPAGGGDTGAIRSIDDIGLPLDLQKILEEPARRAKEMEENPLHYLSEDVKDIVKDLGGMQTDDPVQNKQAMVLAQLDAIIEKLLQQQQQSSSSSSGSGGANPSPTSPTNDSMLTGGPGGMGALNDPNTSHRDWAKLPPAERDKILQSKTENFPAGYEEVLETYYRNLAAEKTTPDTQP